MAALTGEEIQDMIDEMQARAENANGKLTDLALPEEMYETFRQYVINNTKLYVDPDAKGFIYAGTKIHTGELD